VWAPRFDATPEERIAARALAIADARTKPEALAREAGLRVLSVSQIVEIGDVAGLDGADGTDDWGWSALGGIKVRESSG